MPSDFTAEEQGASLQKAKDGKKETHEEERIRARTLEEELEAKHSVTRFVERFKETEAQESIKKATTPPMGLGVEKFILTGQPSLRRQAVARDPGCGP